MLNNEIADYKNACALSHCDYREYLSLWAYCKASNWIRPSDQERSKTEIGNIEEQIAMAMRFLLDSKKFGKLKSEGTVEEVPWDSKSSSMSFFLSERRHRQNHCLPRR